MPREMLPHVKRVVSKGRPYLYFDTGQRKLDGSKIFAPLPPLNDAAFAGRYAALCAGRTKRAAIAAELTVPALIERYRKAPQYAALAPASRKLYDIYLGRAAEWLPSAPAAELNAQDMAELMDGLSRTPSAANAFLRTMQALYAWARRRRLLANDPCLGVDTFQGGEHQPWPADLLSAALTTDDDAVRLSVHMLYFTAQRIGDVRQARWADMGAGVWRMTQQKTGKALIIRLHRDLVAELARHEKTGPFVFVGRSGPMSQEMMRVRIKAFASGLGFDVVPHGLRKNAVIALLEAGCSSAETAAISGQSLKLVEYYARGRDQETLGNAAMKRWENK